MFKKTDTLLSVSKDAKTVKGEALGVMSGILYLAPYDVSGFQVCPKASTGCKASCLYLAGQGVYNNVQQARINKTRWFFQERESFMHTLVENIETLIRKARRSGMKPAVRLNGTSDLPWEKIKAVRLGVEYKNLMLAFPEVMFYDYTKVAGRKYALSIPNYHLTFSLSEENDAEARQAIAEGYNVAVVMKVKRKQAKPETWGGFPVVDGDVSDVRFFDPKGGHIVGLFPKGKGTKDTAGFVRSADSGFLNRR